MQQSLLSPTLEELIEVNLDITHPGMPVEIKVDSRGILWVNVGPVCVLRICRIPSVTIEAPPALAYCETFIGNNRLSTGVMASRISELLDEQPHVNKTFKEKVREFFNRK